MEYTLIALFIFTLIVTASPIIALMSVIILARERVSKRETTLIEETALVQDKDNWIYEQLETYEQLSEEAKKKYPNGKFEFIDFDFRAETEIAKDKGNYHNLSPQKEAVKNISLLDSSFRRIELDSRIDMIKRVIKDETIDEIMDTRRIIAGLAWIANDRVRQSSHFIGVEYKII
jgi:hypothetical protein